MSCGCSGFERFHVGDTVKFTYAFKQVSFDSSVQSTLECNEQSPYDLTGATVVISFKRPDGTIAAKSSAVPADAVTIATPATDGLASFQADTDFLSASGFWTRQATVTKGSEVFRSSTRCFEVLPNLS